MGNPMKRIAVIFGTRPFAGASGTVKIVGAKADDIFHEARQLLVDKALYARMASAVNPYGDGHATERVVSILKNV